MTPENSRPRARRRLALFGTGIALGLITVALFHTVRQRERSAAPPAEAGSSPAVSASPTMATSRTAPPAMKAADPDDAQLALDQRWDDLIARAHAAVGGGPDKARAFVYALFAALDQRSAADRLAAVLGFFESGRDVRLGQGFTIGRGGYLQDWPTLRVALLDYLAQRDGDAARDLAHLLLQSRPAEPGEWTLALRELARGKHADQWTPLVAERMHAFANDPEWARQAPRSWLEGFDVIVAGRSATYLPDLAAVATRAPTRAAKFAGFLAADRLMLAAPAPTLAALNHQPALFAAEPNVRAGIFARADVRQPEQLRELETYFARDDVTDAERARFGGLFPHYDFAVSNNLLTPPASRSMADMLAHDKAALVQIDRWLADARFRAAHAALRESSQRLREEIPRTSAAPSSQ